jgi:hypothetical protein
MAWRVHRAALDRLGELPVVDAEPICQLQRLGHALDQDRHVRVDDELQLTALARVAQPHSLAAGSREHRAGTLRRSAIRLGSSQRVHLRGDVVRQVGHVDAVTVRSGSRTRAPASSPQAVGGGRVTLSCRYAGEGHRRCITSVGVVGRLACE